MELAPIAEPQLVLCKDNASASAMELAPIAEPQLILYKDTTKAHNHQTQRHFFAQRTANYATPSVPMTASVAWPCVHK